MLNIRYLIRMFF